MTRRRWLIILGVLSVAVAGVGVYALILPKPGVTRENFRRLHQGMTREQVEAILGSKGQTTETWKGSKGSVATVEWQGDKGAIQIAFFIYTSDYAGQGQFTKGDAVLERLAAEPEGVVAMFRRWLGW